MDEESGVSPGGGGGGGSAGSGTSMSSKSMSASRTVSLFFLSTLCFDFLPSSLIGMSESLVSIVVSFGVRQGSALARCVGGTERQKDRKQQEQENDATQNTNDAI